MPITTSQNKKWVFPLLLLVLCTGLYAYTFDSKIAMLGDNANYYSLGSALAQGEGYTNISKVTKTPNNHYPPGFPVLISVIKTLGGEIQAVKLFNGLLLFLSILLVFDITSKITENQVLAFVCSLLAMVNSHLLMYGSLMMSEVPFLFFSLLSIWLFIKADKKQLSLKNWALIGSILAMIAAFYIRSLGIALLGGYVLYFLLKKEWKFAGLYFVAQVAAALPWFIRSQKLGGGSYTKQLAMINPYQPNLGKADFGDFVDRFFSNLERYITYEIPSSIFSAKEPLYNQSAKPGEWLIGLIILGICIYGVLALKKYRWLVLGYLLGTFGILMLWPSVWIGVRFIVPLIPILVVVFYFGLYQLLTKISELAASKSLSPYWLVIFLFFSISPVNALNKNAKTPYSNAWKNYFTAARYVKNNLNKNVVVSCGKPALFHLESESFTMRYKFASDPAELIKDLEENQVDYVVVDQVYGNTFRYLVPAIRQYPDRFEQVLHLKNPDTFLLKFKK